MSRRRSVHVSAIGSLLLKVLFPKFPGSLHDLHVLGRLQRSQSLGDGSSLPWNRIDLPILVYAAKDSEKMVFVLALSDDRRLTANPHGHWP